MSAIDVTMNVDGARNVRRIAAWISATIAERVLMRGASFALVPRPGDREVRLLEGRGVHLERGERGVDPAHDLVRRERGAGEDERPVAGRGEAEPLERGPEPD